jgi:uncharacterized protein YggE
MVWATGEGRGFMQTRRGNSTAGTAEQAREKNAERTTEVIARLREVFGPDAVIRTANYSLNTNYSNGYAAKTPSRFA